ncbi:hypothetical protein M758_10G085800 [Ceratodon purpureus]|nr:hypothetical protein M758_10G085700 [Ceratodon purpureus]KAG0603334.1 hypothetical protein M758_10G085800 [Ceratodon purpureus]
MLSGDSPQGVRYGWRVVVANVGPHAAARRCGRQQSRRRRSGLNIFDGVHQLRVSVHRPGYPSTFFASGQVPRPFQLCYRTGSASVWVSVLVGPREGRSKNRDMPVCVPSARYSLVKGERIVRSVLSTRLRDGQSGDPVFVLDKGGSALAIADGT